MLQSFVAIQNEFRDRMANHKQEIVGFADMRRHRKRRANVGEIRQKLIRNATPAEVRFKMFLEREHIPHIFQHPLVMSGKRTAVLDFYLPTSRIVVELDGSVHGSDFAKAHDSTREALVLKYMKKARFIRFTNQQVFSGEAERLFKANCWPGPTPKGTKEPVAP